MVNKFINELTRESVTVLRARADLYGKQVFYRTNNCRTSLYICTVIWTVFAFTLDILIMVNWQLPKQGIPWPVSRDRIAGSGLELIEVTCFEVDRFPDTGFRLDSGLKSGHYSEGEGGGTCKANFPLKLTPGAFLTFLLRTSLYIRLSESLS